MSETEESGPSVVLNSYCYKINFSGFIPQGLAALSLEFDFEPGQNDVLEALEDLIVVNLQQQHFTNYLRACIAKLAVLGSGLPDQFPLNQFSAFTDYPLGGGNGTQCRITATRTQMWSRS